MTKSLRWRLMTRPRIWLQVPIVHPAEERWRRAAFGDHVCQPFVVYLEKK